MIVSFIALNTHPNGLFFLGAASFFFFFQVILSLPKSNGSGRKNFLKYVATQNGHFERIP